MLHCTEPVIWFSKIHFGVTTFDSEHQEKENLAHVVHKNSLKNYPKPGAAAGRCEFKATEARSQYLETQLDRGDGHVNN